MRIFALAALTLITACTQQQPSRTETAICHDGTESYSQATSGTCSHHGGVREWVNRP